MATRNSLQSPTYVSSAASSSSLITPTLSALADPPIHLADAAALDYLIIEMTHALRASASVAAARTKKIEREMVEAGLLPAPPEKNAAAKENEKERLKKEQQRESMGSAGTKGSVIVGGFSVKATEVDEDEEGLRIRLEAIGVQVGGNIAER